MISPCNFPSFIYNSDMKAPTLRVCTGKVCTESFSSYILTRLEADKEFYSYDPAVRIESAPCMGQCQQWPNISLDNEIHHRQNPIKASELLRKKVAEWKSSHQ